MVIASVAGSPSANQGSEPCGRRIAEALSFARAIPLRARATRYAVNGAWPAVTRIDMLAAYHDFQKRARVGARCRGLGRAKEATWVKVIVDEHVAPRIRIWQNLTSRLGSART